MDLPDLSNLDLAYETGLHIGDGNLSGPPAHDYRYVLSGNANTEFEFYTLIISPLIEKLYSLKPYVYTNRNSIYSRVYSKDLVMFKARELGLPIGPKRQMTRLPLKIVEHGKEHVSQILSGLYDTDGSPKIRKTPSRWYPRISIAQRNEAIVREVHRLLYDVFDITNTLYRNVYHDSRYSTVAVRWFLDINGFENLAKFIKCIGSRHPVVRGKLKFLESLRGQL